MMEKQRPIWRLPVIWKLLKASFNGLKQNDPLRMAGATAFFTSFALPPIIVLLFQLFSIFFSRQLVRTEMIPPEGKLPHYVCGLLPLESEIIEVLDLDLLAAGEESQ